MNILLTNDDGIASIGIQKLGLCLSDLGHNTKIIAPSHCRSANSMSLTINKKMLLTEHNINGISNAYSLDGTSVDCVKLALIKFNKPKIDLVISGINIGANVARDLHYSATVGAAIEACLSDVPAIAISAECDNNQQNCRFDDANQVLIKHFNNIYHHLIANKYTFANINVPLNKYKNIFFTKAAHNLVYEDAYQNAGDYYQLIGGRDTKLRNHQLDLGAINDGYASISYLKPQWN